MPSTGGTGQNQEMQQCIQLCQECATTCQQIIMYCLQQGGKHADVAHIGVLLDCAQICQTCENMMLRDSPYSGRICGDCAQVCDGCAASCEQFTGDTRLQNCAQLCRRCAEACRKMAA